MDNKTIATATEARPPLIIDAGMYGWLLALAERQRKKTPQLADQLIEELERAELRLPESMPNDVVTIGSTVTYREGARTQTVAIVLPHQADIEHGRISVIAPVGTALLGLSVGQRITWKMPDGRARQLEVLEARRAE
jgi:regulator of nucleoside diphosphate kinase